MGRQQMRIADSCMKKEKEKGKSIPEDRQDPKECFSDVINQSRIRKTNFSLVPHTGRRTEKLTEADGLPPDTAHTILPASA